MIVFHSPPKTSSNGRIILVFGIGLVGSSICKDIHYRSGYSSCFLPFRWEKAWRYQSDGNDISTYLRSILKTFQSSDVSIVWSAGKSGFFTDKKDTDAEMQSYEVVLSMLRALIEEFPENRYFFHLISSAGGLFEGQNVIGIESKPHPLRPYGKLKLDQELRLLSFDEKLNKCIYRLTSVFGYIGENHRMGLITALINNGIKNRISTIFGNMATLRDYLHSDELGGFVASKLFDTSAGFYKVYYLGSGKPSSIYEIVRLVEQELGRKIYIQFSSASQYDNSLNIVLNNSLLPNDWRPVDLKSSVRYLKESIFAEQNRKFNVARVSAQDHLP